MKYDYIYMCVYVCAYVRACTCVCMFVFVYVCDILFVLLIDFYGIVGYLLPNPDFTYILTIWFVNTIYRFRQLNNQTVLFQIIQFSINQQS